MSACGNENPLVLIRCDRPGGHVGPHECLVERQQFWWDDSGTRTCDLDLAALLVEAAGAVR